MNHFRHNPAAFFIVGYQALLFVCAGLLISDSSLWAEGVAVLAYFFLVIGVVLQLIFFTLSKDEEDKKVCCDRDGVEISAISQESDEKADRRSLDPGVSLVIPAFNEENRIEETLVQWMSVLDEHCYQNYEILVTVDGCTDKTGAVVSRLARKSNALFPIFYPKRLGKGGALIEAFKRSRREIIFYIDADGSLPAYEFSRFMRVIGECDLTIGSRYLGKSHSATNVPTTRFISSRIFNALLRTFFNELRFVYDTQCGAKAIHRKVIDTIWEDLRATDFSFDVNLIYSTLRNGFCVKEIGIDYNHVETESKVSGNLLKTSLAMLLSIIRLRLYYSRIGWILNSSSLKRPIEILLRYFY